MASTLPRCASILIARSSAWCLQDSFLFDGTIRENVAFSKPDATEEEILRACAICARGRVCREVRAEVRHHHRRARREALRRPAPARLHRARDPGQSAHPDPRRSDLQPRLRIRGADPAGPRLPDAGPHNIRHRPPPVDHSPRRPDPGRRGRTRSSSAAPTSRCTISAAATTTSIPGSTASSRTCSSRPAKAMSIPEEEPRRQPLGRRSRGAAAPNPV